VSIMSAAIANIERGTDRLGCYIWELYIRWRWKIKRWDQTRFIYLSDVAQNVMFSKRDTNVKFCRL